VRRGRFPCRITAAAVFHALDALAQGQQTTEHCPQGPARPARRTLDGTHLERMLHEKWLWSSGPSSFKDK